MTRATVIPSAGASCVYNTHCPLSGQAVSAHALAQYKGVIIGFCDGAKRDDFIADPKAYPSVLSLVDTAHMMIQKGTYNPRLRWFGRRIGAGLRDIHKKLLHDMLPHVEITPDYMNNHQKRPLEDLFEGKKDIWLEVGFGGGEHLIAQAQAHPDIGFIGCEPYLNGVANLLKQMKEQDVHNIRIWADDARSLMDVLPPQSLGRVFVLFADPWPKKRHQRRRFINQENLDQLVLLMKNKALLRFASDHMDYTAWVVGHILAHPSFEWLAETPASWLDIPADHYKTRYQIKAKEQDIISRFIDIQKRDIT